MVAAPPAGNPLAVTLETVLAHKLFYFAGTETDSSGVLGCQEAEAPPC